MKFNKGDKVKFLNDTGGGEVTKVISKDMVNVLNEDGFEVPVLMEELLKIEEEEQEKEQEQSMDTKYTPTEESVEFNAFNEEEPDPEQLESVTDPDNHVYFAFVPLDQDNPQNSDLQLYLINDSDFYVFYLILLKGERSYSYFSSGVLEDNTKIYLKQVERENLSEMEEFKIQFIFYQKSYFRPVPAFETALKLKPQKFYKSTTFKENDFFEENAHLIEKKRKTQKTYPVLSRTTRIQRLRKQTCTLKNWLNGPKSFQTRKCWISRWINFILNYRQP